MRLPKPRVEIWPSFRANFGTGIDSDYARDICPALFFMGKGIR